MIAELGKRGEKYDLINSLAEAQAGITFSHIAHGYIDFVKTELQRTLAGKMDRSVLNFVGTYEVHEVTLLRHLLVRVEVCSEPTMDWFESDEIPSVISHKMVGKLPLRMKATNRAIKVANYASEKCEGTLKEVPISLGDLVVPMDLHVLEEALYHIFISSLAMIQLHARPDYYRMALKIYHGGDSEIFNYEYERDIGNTSEDEFT